VSPIFADNLLYFNANVVIFVKKLLGDDEIEAVLQRLDRLTQDEARTTAAQTLGVVHGLAQDMKVVMDGEQFLLRSSVTCH
jgi:hypothetical protein